jgi:hypothetical protein
VKERVSCGRKSHLLKKESTVKRRVTCERYVHKCYLSARFAKQGSSLQETRTLDTRPSPPHPEEQQGFISYMVPPPPPQLVTEVKH